MRTFINKFIFAGIILLLAVFSRANSVVVFNEIMYHPSDNEPQMEWIELHNQMAVDVDLSNWSIVGGVNYTFPNGSIILGGSYIVVAVSPSSLEMVTELTNVYGPFTGRLSNSGEKLELRDNSGRKMDELSYKDSGLWPVAADGSGASLSKNHPNIASAPSENWTASSEVKGSPGFENIKLISSVSEKIIFNEILENSESNFWIEIVNLGTNNLQIGGYKIRSSGAASDYVFLPSIIAPEEYRVITANELGFNPANGDKLFIYSSNLTEVLDGISVSTKLHGRNKFGEWMFPNLTTPGAENSFDLHDEIVINEIMYHHRPEYEEPGEEQKQFFIPFETVWNYDDTGANLGTAWRDPSYNDSSWLSGAALLYYDPDPLPAPKNTELDKGNKLTFYFRTEFSFTGKTNNLALFFNPIIDDGAVFYLNGVEIYRFNMPSGEILATTLAAGRIGEANFTGPYSINPTNLVQGVNVFAVEVHQHHPNSSDVAFGMELYAITNTTYGTPFAESDEQWIELFNRGTGIVDISNWELDRAINFTFPSGTILSSGEYLVVAKDMVSLKQLYPFAQIIGNFSGKLSHRDETILLKDNNGNPADEVHYYDGFPWPEHTDGGGSSLELRNPFSDNNKPEVWENSDESSRSSWQNINYKMTGQQLSAAPTYWNEFLMGLSESGEVLVDDVSVIENPESSPMQLIQNGTFDSGTNKWRINGTHSTSSVIDDSDSPGNKVLKLVARGPCRHSYNHAETTFSENRGLSSANEYEISFRAKWQIGSPRLRTWLYFNRCARSTILNIPEKSGTPGEQNSCYETNLGPTFSVLNHFPAVPNANQEVTISVKVNDNDGVQSCNLYWSLAEGTWINFPMLLNTNGIYSAEIPGFNSGSIVHFYIEAIDSLNNKATYPAVGAESRVLYQVQNGLTTTLPTHNFRVIMLESDANRMYNGSNVLNNDYERGTIIYDETQIFYNAKIKIKGNISRYGGTTGHKFLFPADNLFRGVHKKVMSDPNGRLMGLSRTDSGQCQEEILLKHIANRAGGLYSQYDDLMHIIIPFSGGTQAKKALLMMGRFSSDYFDSYFDDGGGQPLYKFEYLYALNRTVTSDPESEKYSEWPFVSGIGDIYNLGDDKEVYRWLYLIKSGRTEYNYSPIMNLCKTFSMSGAEINNAAKNIIDESQWMRNFAFLSLGCVFDTYNFGSSHNNMFYQRPTDGKFLVLSIDMDWAFEPSNRWRGVAAPLYGATATYGYNKYNFGKIIEIPRNLRLLYGHFKDIIEKSYNPDYMQRWATHYYSLLQNLNHGYNFDCVVDFIRDRGNFVLSQLPPEIPFKISTNGGNDFSTNVLEISLKGTAWIDVKEIRSKNPPPPLSLNWSTITNWQTTVKLHSGTNFIELLCYNFSGEFSKTSSITIICTLPDPSRGMVINEFLAKNDSINFDENGDYDDWIELYNAGTNLENVGGLFLTDDTTFPTKWMLPETNILPGNFLLIWADDETNQGQFHAPFKLSTAGEQIGLYNISTSELHTIFFGLQQADISSGLFPDGNLGELYQLSPTHGETNVLPEPVFTWIVGLIFFFKIYGMEQ